MPDSKWEAAKRCYVCQIPGEEKDKRKQPRPSGRRGMCTVYTFECRNERCRKYEFTWIVQVNDDGSIPERAKGPKEFPGSERMVNMGKAYIDHLKSEMDKGETSSGF